MHHEPVFLAVQMERGMRKAAARRAAREGHTLSAWVRGLIDRALEQPPCG